MRRVLRIGESSRPCHGISKPRRGERELMFSCELDREPTDKDMKIIFPSEAKTTLGHHASKVEGTTWLCNDPAQFLDHYYQ